MLAEKSKKYNPALLRAMRLGGLVAMIIQSIYAAAAYFIGGESLHESTLFGYDFTWILIIIFLAVGLQQIFFKPKTRKPLIFGLLLFYFAIALFVLFVSRDPVISHLTWLILLIVTGVMFGHRALLIGSIGVASIMLVDLFLRGNASFAVIASAVLELSIVIIIASYVNHLRSIGVVKFEVYEQVKSREKIQSRRLETVINSINDAILNISSSGQIRFYNAATQMLLDTNDSINGKNVDEVFHLQNENGEPIKLTSLLKDSKQTFERSDLMHEYGDGQKINLFLSISRVRGTFDVDSLDADLGGIILIARDITKQKSLDDERDEFISVVSHELRTPVAISEGALSNLEFILGKNGGDQTVIDSVEQAHKQIVLLAQMVNDLSTLSRAQRGVNMEYEQIELKEFMNELYKKYLPEAKERKLHLNIDLKVAGSVKVPRMVIEEIMQNLIMNAIKYTKVGSVTIGARKVKNQPNNVEIFVSDTGIGISKTDQSHAFQKFWRSEDYRTRETSGTGLGLHVVEKLANTIKTRVELQSRLNHGSTFSFKLPLDSKIND